MSVLVEKFRLILNVGILALTIIIASIILVVGYVSTPEVPPEIAISQRSPQDFVANRTTSDFPDPDKTKRARDLAENNVPAPYEINTTTSQNVINNINALFTDLEEGAFLPAPPPATTKVPDLVGLKERDAGKIVDDAKLVLNVIASTDTTNEVLDGTIESQVPSPGVTVLEGVTINVVVYAFVSTSSSSTSSTSTTTTTTTVPETTTTTLPRRDFEKQIALLEEKHPVLESKTIAQFVSLYDSDLDRVARGEPSVFPEMQRTAIGWARDEITAGIRLTELDTVVAKYLNAATRPPILIVDLPEADIDDTREALANLVARRLQVNEVVDQTQWELDKQAARDAVAQQTTSYALGDTIAEEGEVLTSVQVAAITELELYSPEITKVAPAWGLVLLGAISILIFAFLLYRIAPKNVYRPRDVVLLSIILLLAAFAARIPGIVTSPENHSIGYVIPTVAIGVMAAILFDHRTALLVAITMAGFTAIATNDLTFTVFAGIAAAIPVAFVSSVSTRSQLRLSVLGSAAVAAPVAAGLEFLFRFGSSNSDPFQAAAWALAGAIVGGFIGQGLVSFMETAFGVTTTMSLLDLLDRNHPALEELEEKAPGTFNHSMLVGSLAGRAARAIDADPLFAQAAAWYHDLGKTENPQYFVENQLGYNPHDDLSPEDSAEIIRGHVITGLELAKQFRIPEDVANGIRMHHGTSLMRYFYHKALAEDENVDPELFRHHGVKPTRREMAIVMIADATEAAARAYAQQGQPTEEGLAKLVDAIVGEKLEDGQFDDSSLTFGELTMIRREVVAGLSAYYHARVEYPDFPTGETPGAP